MTSAEYEKNLIDWNDTKAEYPKEKTVCQMFEEQVEKTPDNLAVIFKDQFLTYRQLNEQANQLAYYLKLQNVGPDTPVAIAIERSFEMLVGLLGILKAGGAYVPLDPTYPEARLNYMLLDAQIKFLITQEKFLNKFRDYSGKFACLHYNREKQKVEIADHPNLSNWNISLNQINNHLHYTKPNNLAYIVYTSGSSGKPKGVMIQHQSLTNFLVSISKKLKIVSQDRLLAITTLSFDIATLELLSPLINGASLLLTPQTISSDPNDLHKKMIEYDPTIIQATPSFWKILLDNPLNMYDTNFKILCGGEALSIDLAKKFVKYRGEFWNLYGPTETTIWSTVKHFHMDSCLSSISIGKPIDNTHVYILDEKLNLVSVGLPGELYIGGDGLARGYCRRPDLTAERFIPNPFVSEFNPSYMKLYRTGDLARYLPDGSIEFLGRIDDQIKIRGFRVELKEIVTSLLTHEGVTQVIVTTIRSELDHKQLVAYIVPDDNMQKRLKIRHELVSHYQQTYNVLTGHPIPSLIEDLWNHLKKFIPDYMIPSFFVFLDKIPITPNGKTDEQSLSSLDFSYIKPVSKYIGPCTQTEKNLTKIWIEILKIEKISLHDNFFKIGGDSIISFQIISRARQQGIFFTVEDMFNHPTIRELASIAITEKRALNIKQVSILEKKKPGSTKYMGISQERIDFVTEDLLSND